MTEISTSKLAKISAVKYRLAWKWVNVNYPAVAERIRLLAYRECGVESPPARLARDRARDIVLISKL